MNEFLRRAGYLLSRGRRRRELEDEMAFHREMAARSGNRAASFGNPALLREQAREAWGWTWIDRLFQDLRYATRMLMRSPGFTLTAVLVLALGIGINVAAFSAFNLLTLKSLPVRDPDSLLRLQRRSPEGAANMVPYPSMLFYRDHARTLSAIMGTVSARVTLDTDAQPAQATFVTENYFSELGTEPMKGRLLDSDRDAASDAAPVVVLSYGFWQRRFGSDPSIVGKVIQLNLKPATIVGVLPYALATLDDEHADFWIPITQVPYFIAGSTALTDTRPDLGAVKMWGRLAPGASPQTAEQELIALTNQLRTQYPKDIWDHEYIHSDPGGHHEVMRGEDFIAVAMVGSLAMLILAAACANLGGLLLARGVAREQEIGIRVALGASRGRVFRQLLTESMFLAFLGTIAGLFLGYVVLRITMAHSNAPLWMTPTPDWRVALFALGMGLFAAIVFGFTPALQIARRSRHKTLARQTLIAVQVTASCILLILSGLLVRAAQHAIVATPGFGYEQVLSVDLNLGSHGVKPANARNLIGQFEDRVRSLPGVTSVTLASTQPLGHDRISTVIATIDGHQVRVFPMEVDPQFFSTMGIPILRGRNFLPGEQHAILISDSLARKQWPGEDPLGKQDASGSAPGEVVVGVVASARLIDRKDGSAVELYRAAQEADMPNLYVLVKTAGAPDGLVPLIRSTAQNIDPQMLPETSLLKADFKQETDSAGRVAMVVSLMGTIALFLSGLGILGLVAYTVSQRTREIAIRTALGAQPVQLLASLFQQFYWPIVIGLTVGVGAAVALSRILRGLLYGVSNLDPLSYGTAVAILVTIFMLAALFPARRALKLDVAQALHQE